MNQKESSDGCGGILIGAIVGVFAGYFVYRIVSKIVGPTDPKTETHISGFAAIIAWCICVWIAGNIADGTFAAKFIKTKTINPEVVRLISLTKKSQHGPTQPKRTCPKIFWIRYVINAISKDISAFGKINIAVGSADM